LLIKDKTGPQEKVKALKAQLAPTDYASKMFSRERYRKAQNVGRSEVETWIQVWERALLEAKQNKLGEVHYDIDATCDFLGAVEDIVPGFSSYWREKIRDWKHRGKEEKIPDGFKIAQYFRDSLRTQAAIKLSKGPSNSGAFSAGESTSTPGGNNAPTLQGQKPPSEKEKCVCGTVRTKEHHWRSCQYARYEILGEAFPVGFKVDNSLVKKTKENLKRERFRKFVQKILTAPGHQI
jgi:hypothetical protein